ncbi:hypothetical protein GCM10025771_14700 [Niveibacterium umoris]|uniref:Uncharacterized protein n=1 Tax=Niveibacterium umoris TaxID=1193620 RepID=A0A840BN10_9RHOO|nr:hypothetical protein [Niveibacterium umoris]MBB4014655.1 hypothetical protein [Niveibacterium umoris]
MGMHIVSKDISDAETLLNQGRLSDMYSLLASKGDRYAELANGVAKGDTLAGQTALNCMKQTAW